MPDPQDYVNEADVAEQETPLVEEEDTDEEASAGRGTPRRRDDVNEADFVEQSENVSGDDDDYPYGEPEPE